MNSPRPAIRRKVQSRVLLAAATGAAVVTFASCGGTTVGNLIAPPVCQAGQTPATDGCRLPLDSDGGSDGGSDAGPDGGH
jgi:altronate dehydratase